MRRPAIASFSIVRTSFSACSQSYNYNVCAFNLVSGHGTQEAAVFGDPDEPGGRNEGTCIPPFNRVSKSPGSLSLDPILQL